MRQQMLPVLTGLFLLGSTGYSANTVVSQPLSPHRDPSGRILENLPPCGPTENSSKVCYSIRKSVKSVTQSVKVDAGLTLTQPVTISALLSGCCPQRITQTYNPATGTASSTTTAKVTENLGPPSRISRSRSQTLQAVCTLTLLQERTPSSRFTM